MRNIIKAMKNIFRPFRNIIFTFFDLLYDFRRLYKYGGWRDSLNDSTQRNYKVAKAYHSLEKSLSFPRRKRGAGWSAVEKIIRLLKAIKSDEVIGFQEKVSISVLEDFLNAETDEDGLHKSAKENSVNLINKFHSEGNNVGGVKIYGVSDLKRGMLKNPETFFFQDPR